MGESERFPTWADARGVRHLPVEIIAEPGFEPTLATDGSAAYDLKLWLPPKEREEGYALRINDGVHALGCGFRIWIRDPRYFGLVSIRSGLARRYGITLANGVGVLDSDYQGPVSCSVVRGAAGHAAEQIFTHALEHGERFAQLTILERTALELLPAREFSHVTARGAGGFGSTGTK